MQPSAPSDLRASVGGRRRVCLICLIRLAEPRQTDDVQFVTNIFFSQPSRNFVAADVRQGDVEHDNAGFEVARKVEGRRSVMGGLHFVAQQLKQQRQSIRQIRQSVDHENASSFFHRPLQRGSFHFVSFDNSTPSRRHLHAQRRHSNAQCATQEAMLMSGAAMFISIERHLSSH